MSIKKTLLAFAAMALAIGAFASPAMAATDGKLVDLDQEGHPDMAANTTLHFEGPAEFNTLGTGIRCEVTATILMTNASTGHPVVFRPTTSTCEGFGFIYEGCEVVGDSEVLENHVTVTPDDFDITGFAELFAEHDAGCSVPTTQLEFENAITADPIDTDGNTLTETTKPIAGIEFETEGRATNAFGTFGVVANAELYLTEDEACTYGLSTEI